MLHAGQLLFKVLCVKSVRRSARASCSPGCTCRRRARRSAASCGATGRSGSVVTLDTIHEITRGRACPDHPFSHPLGFEVLAPLSLRDRWIFLRANRLAFHVPAARTSSRHVLDWLRKPFCGGPHWLHQDRLQFWLDADGAKCWELPDSEEESEDYNTDGSDDLNLPERLRPSVAEMARRAAARYPLPI